MYVTTPVELFRSGAITGSELARSIDEKGFSDSRIVVFPDETEAFIFAKGLAEILIETYGLEKMARAKMPLTGPVYNPPDPLIQEITKGFKEEKWLVVPEDYAAVLEKYIATLPMK
ncbi:MAG: hypothetical protein GXP63_05415 [DPANN group archaeon]|nr:hypothetical protein [DPANN group archaeon]